MDTLARNKRSVDEMLLREQIANRKKHWVRAVTACNSKCLFCLDADTPRNVYLEEADVKAELLRGREELDADKVIISGGEASLHPLFPEFIRYAKEIGYDRVQTVTNGTQYANKDFYERCVKAGLGEITFSLHGDTPELHDYLTQTPDCFNKLMKALIRCVRDPRVITNVDVVINKQNVGVLDKIVELAISVGVTEFDLLHVIPQSNAYRNRDEMFYDVREHLPVLQKVFRLNRHPRFYIWTNRFPVSYLEGLEDLIQDPHKMLDEVNGRRFQVRRYLDDGNQLDCREPDRCKHCFIEPFCNTVDNVVKAQNESAWDNWWIQNPNEAQHAPQPLPYGCSRIAFNIKSLQDIEWETLPPETGICVRPEEDDALPKQSPTNSEFIAHRAGQLDAWLTTNIPTTINVRIELNVETSEWMLKNRDLVERHLAQLHIHQPSHEKLNDAVHQDVRNPAAFFSRLALPVSVSGLPACMTPGVTLADDPMDLDSSLFNGETGRLEIRPLARYHVENRYRGKSVRCADCRVTDRCEGIQINMIRDQGLKLAQPLESGEWADNAEQQLLKRWPQPPPRVHDGRDAQPVAASLPGFAEPESAPHDPLAVIARQVEMKNRKRAERRANIKAQLEES